MTQNVEKTFTNGTDCNNGVFGDPAVGSAKNCWVALPGSSSGSTGSGSSPGSGSTPGNGITPANTTWTQCATQNGYCSFTGTMVVLYGTLTQNVEKTFANGTACNNGVCGDPAVGVSDKACWVAVPNTTTGGGPGSGSGSGSGGSMPPTQTMSCTSPTKSGAPSGIATVSADTPGSDSTRMFAMGCNFSRAVLTNVASSDTLNWSIADATGKVATSGSFAGPAGATRHHAHVLIDARGLLRGIRHAGREPWTTAAGRHAAGGHRDVRVSCRICRARWRRRGMRIRTSIASAYKASMATAPG